MTLDIPVTDREPLPFRMRSRIGHVSGVAVLRLSGEIDVNEAPELEASLARAIAQSDGVLVLDLRGVTFLDLAGMFTIIRSILRAASAGSEVSVVSAGPRVRKVFALSGNLGFLDSPASLVDVSIAASIAPPQEAGAPDE